LTLSLPFYSLSRRLARHRYLVQVIHSGDLFLLIKIKNIPPVYCKPSHISEKINLNLNAKQKTTTTSKKTKKIDKL